MQPQPMPEPAQANQAFRNGCSATALTSAASLQDFPSDRTALYERSFAAHQGHDQISINGQEVIRPLDVLFGHLASLERGNHHMAHRTGFTADTLGQALIDAGFAEVRVHRGRNWDLWAIATIPDTHPDVFNQLAGVML